MNNIIQFPENMDDFIKSSTKIVEAQLDDDIISFLFSRGISIHDSMGVKKPLHILLPEIYDCIANIPEEEMYRPLADLLANNYKFFTEIMYRHIPSDDVGLIVNIQDSKGNTLSSYKIMSRIFNEDVEKYAQMRNQAVANITNGIFGKPYTPIVEQAIYAKNKDAVDYLYRFFNQPCRNEVYNELVNFKKIKPDFYNYVTTHLDIPTIEQYKEAWL